MNSLSRKIGTVVIGTASYNVLINIDKFANKVSSKNLLTRSVVGNMGKSSSNGKKLLRLGSSTYMHILTII